jgi:hypothetical protein
MKDGVPKIKKIIKMKRIKIKTISKSVYKTGYTYPVPSNLTYS